MRDVATVVGNWWREFGDNDALGWTITAAYFVTAALCFRAARRLWRQRVLAMPEPVSPGRAPVRESSNARDWAVIGVGMVLLGLNKQLDLQILARDASLAVVKAAGCWSARCPSGSSRRWRAPRATSAPPAAATG